MNSDQQQLSRRAARQHETSTSSSAKKKEPRQIEGARPQLQITAPVTPKIATSKSLARVRDAEAVARPDAEPEGFAQSVSRLESMLAHTPVSQKETKPVKQPLASTSSDKKITRRRIEGAGAQLQITAQASLETASHKSAAKTEHGASSIRSDFAPKSLAQSLSRLVNMLAHKPTSQKEDTSTGTRPDAAPKGLAQSLSRLDSMLAHKPVSQKKDAVLKQQASAQLGNDCGVNPHLEHPGREKTTTLASYDTSQWGGAARQEAASQGATSLRRYDDSVSNELAQAALGVCPKQFRWWPVKLGYLCGGGNHLITHREAEKFLAGERPDGPCIEAVNTGPDYDGRAVTPPPGSGGGFWNLDKEAYCKANVHPLPKNHRGHWWDGERYCEHRHEMWRYKRSES